MSQELRHLGGEGALRNLLIERAQLAARVLRDDELAEAMSQAQVDRAGAGIALDLLGAFASDLAFELAIGVAQKLNPSPAVLEAIRQLEVCADPVLNAPPPPPQESS